MIDQDDQYLEMFGDAIQKLGSRLQDGGPPVDWELIVAFVDGALPKADELTVQANILRFRSWYEARLEVCGAVGEHEPESTAASSKSPSLEEASSAVDTLIREYATHLSNKEYEIAAKKMRDGLQFASSFFGYTSIEAANLQARLSDALFALGHRAEAEMMLKVALAVFEGLSPQDPRIATGYLRLGRQTAFNGNYTEAVSFVTKAVELRRKLGDAAGQVTCILELGNLAWELNNVEAAVQYATQAVEAQEQLTGRNSFEYAIKADNLALIMTSLSPEDAIKLFEVCRNIFLRYETSQPLDLAICEDNYGIALFRAGRTQDAIAMNETALNRLETINDESSSLVKCLANLGGKILHSGDVSRGLSLLNRARRLADVREVSFKTKLNIAMSLADAMYFSGDLDAARAQYTEIKNQLDGSHLQLTELYSILLNNLAAAVASSEEALAQKLLENAIRLARGRFGQTIPSNFGRLKNKEPLELILAT